MSKGSKTQVMTLDDLKNKDKKVILNNEEYVNILERIFELNAELEKATDENEINLSRINSARKSVRFSRNSNYAKILQSNKTLRNLISEKIFGMFGKPIFQNSQSDKNLNKIFKTEIDLNLKNQKFEKNDKNEKNRLKE